MKSRLNTPHTLFKTTLRMDTTHHLLHMCYAACIVWCSVVCMWCVNAGGFQSTCGAQFCAHHSEMFVLMRTPIQLTPTKGNHKLR